MEFVPWFVPATGVTFRTPEFYDALSFGHSYNFVLTVLDSVKGLGSATIFVIWIEGAP
jgi:hypothetical protein